MCHQDVHPARWRPGQLPAVAAAILALTAGCATGPAIRIADSPVHPQPGQPVALPVVYDADRFYVAPVVDNGARLLFLTDTGGGLFAWRETVDRMAAAQASSGRPGAQDTQRIVTLHFKPDASIPPGRDGGGRLPTFKSSNRASSPEDGMLGQSWFGGRVWTFDYPGRRLLWRAARDVPQTDPTHRVPLGFKWTLLGRFDYPRIVVEIDGQRHHLLFDTGATLMPADAAKAIFPDAGPTGCATSFISESVFERWRTRHPDWRIIPAAEARTGLAIIEVPAVTVGGFTVGPVWFTNRPDRNWKWMSQWTDRPIEGALGGSALKYFRVTVDYPSAVAVFERPD